MHRKTYSKRERDALVIVPPIRHSSRALGDWIVRTSGCVQPLSASIALEMLGFLVGDEELQILKVTLALREVDLLADVARQWVGGYQVIAPKWEWHSQ